MGDVVDAIHNAPELEIKFPETATEQQDLADGFKTKSEIGIPMCVGDATNIIRDGGMFSSRFDGDSDDQWEYDTVNDRLDDLLDGGQHTQDHSRGDRRRHRRTPNLPNQVILDNHVRPLPNQIILDRVFDRSYQRPARSRLRRNSM